MLHTFKLSIVAGALVFFTHTASAASLSLIPATGEFRTGSTITLDLKVDSEGTGINAAQATLRFPKETLQVSSIDKTNSAFSFWLEEPTYSNENGVISFTGGTPYGVSGASIEVFKVTFTSKGSGTAPITLVDAAVTASDGSGTNVLSKTGSASFTLSPTGSVPSATTTGVPVVAAPPKQIVREAAPAVGLPVKPVVIVPLYPDPAEWYNVTNIFSARWSLPADITGVAATIDKLPSSSPQASEGLFDNKSFTDLSDGIWYLHVQFKNNVGWGPATHYRIAVDTKPPLPFQITSLQGVSSDNPTLTLNFKTSDTLSGLGEYHIKINGDEASVVSAKDFSGSYAVPVEQPGKHHIIVSAHDLAGNGIESSFDQETIPLAAPTFTFVTTTLFTDEPTGINLKGTALPNSTLSISLKKGGSLVASSTVASDMNGNWEYTFSDILRSGKYVASIQNKDDRGALSLVINSPEISVTEKPLFQIGILTITKLGAILILIFLIIAGGGSGWWFYRTRRARTALRVDLAESDTAKVFNMIKADIDKLDKARTTPTTVDDEFITQKMRENIKKMETYVTKEINKAKE